MTTVALIVREHPTREDYKRFLVPLEQDDVKGLLKFEPGEVVTIEVRRARSLQHHRLYFSLFRDAVKLGCKVQGNRFHNEEALRMFAQIMVGWCDYFDVGPVRVPVSRSINWSAVDQTLFHKIFDQVVLFLGEECDPPCPSITAIADDLISRGVQRCDLRDAA